MSYIQGTKVLVTGTFTDPDSGAPFDPADVKAIIRQPGATSSATLLYSQGQIVKLSTGKYRFVIDTTPASGEWEYEYGGTGILAVFKRRTLRVRPALS